MVGGVVAGEVVAGRVGQERKVAWGRGWRESLALGRFWPRIEPPGTVYTDRNGFATRRTDRMQKSPKTRRFYPAVKLFQPCQNPLEH